MIVGVVSNRKAIVDVEIADSIGRRRLIPSVVDTGFNGHLTLPSSEIIVALGLSLVGKRRAWLADGSEVELEAYAATIQWHGHVRPIVVSLADGAHL